MQILEQRKSPHPVVWAFLYFPYGLTFGFPSIALGYLGTRAGLHTSAIAGIVGMSFLAAGWKFVWAPIGDYSLSRKTWYRIALVLITIGLVAMTSIPLSESSTLTLSLLVLFTSVSGTFIAFAVEGLMVYNTSPATRGRAAGWFQSGNQFGQTAGGGISLWLINHMPTPWMAGAAIAVIAWACSLMLHYLQEPPPHPREASVASRAKDALRNLGEILRTREGRIALILAILPIGTGAAQFLFGSLAPEWKAPADTVSLVLGAGGGVAIVLGCFAGGRLADAMSKPMSYALSCGLGLVACLAMAASPRSSMGYTASTLFYTFALGMSTASFTAMILNIIGHEAVATKINLFFALNTLFSLFILRANGWAHDAWGTNGMLFTEAGLGVAALVVFLLLAKRVPGATIGAS